MRTPFARRRPRPAARPRLEQLEPRLTPATLRWVGDGATGNWSENGGGNTNWVNADTNTPDVLPAVGDNLVFDDTAVGFRTNTHDIPNLSINNLVVTGDNYVLNGTTGITLTGDVTLAAPTTRPTVGLLFAIGTVRTVNVTGSAILSGDGAGGGGLVKAGAGTLTLTGNNAYAGTTEVRAGTLLVNGANSGGGLTTLTAGTLGGSGTLGPVTAAGGTLAAGAISVAGQLATRDLTLAAASTVAFDVNGLTAGTGHDQIVVTGAVNLGGASININVSGFAPAVGDSFVLVSNDGADPVTGTFAGLAEGASTTAGGFLFRISYAGGDGNDVVLTRLSGGGRIAGTVFNDLNGNKKQDAGEPGLSGFTVFIDADGNGNFSAGDPNATTANDG